MKSNPHSLRLGQMVFLETPLYVYKKPNKIIGKVITKIDNNFFYLGGSDCRYFNDSLRPDGDSALTGRVSLAPFSFYQKQKRFENVDYLSNFCRKWLIGREHQY